MATRDISLYAVLGCLFLTHHTNINSSTHNITRYSSSTLAQAKTPEHSRTSSRLTSLTARKSPERSRATKPGLLQEGSGQSDLDGDGVSDCWQLGYTGGTTHGWWTMNLRAPCRADAINVRLGGSLGTFLSIATLPRELIERPALLEGLLVHWFGRTARYALDTIDGSLNWLLEEYTSDLPPQNLNGWQLGRPHNLRWTTGIPSVPALEVVTLLSPSEQKLGAQLAKRLAIDDEAPAKGPFLLVYFSHNHHSIKPSSRAQDLVVHVTDHAIAVENRREKKWSWIFVNIDQIRLRAPSIWRTVTDGTLVIAEVTAPNATTAHRLVVIDPRTGSWIWHDDASQWRLNASELIIQHDSFTKAELHHLLSS